MNGLWSADEASAVILRGCRGGRGAVLDRGPLVCLREWSRPVVSVRGCVFLQVAEEYEGGLRRHHREVYVLGLKNRGVHKPSPRVADVYQGQLDGGGSGGSSVA
jgi:hypothetical protein